MRSHVSWDVLLTRGRWGFARKMNWGMFLTSPHLAEPRTSAEAKKLKNHVHTPDTSWDPGRTGVGQAQG